MADVLSTNAAEDRTWLVRQGNDFASEITGARFLWPDTLGGTGIPCACSGLQKVERLNNDGGGFSQFFTTTVTVDLLWFDSDDYDGIPQANQGCKVKTYAGDDWHHLKIETRDFPVGGGVIVLTCNSKYESV